MNRERTFLLILAFTFFSIPRLHAALQPKTVEYTQDGKTFEGYLVYDDSFTGKRPGVMVVHEWKGLGDYAKMRADKLAGLGYVAFAADMYGKGIRAETHEQAAALSKPYLSDRQLMRKRAEAAFDVLRKHELVDPARLAAIGYCFGGAAVLEMARSGMDLKGVVSFHGALATPSPAKKGEVKAKVLVFTGANDKFAPQTDVENLEKEFTEADADWQVVVFSNTYHSFTVPEAGNDPSDNIAYNPEADSRSWEGMQTFFHEIFGEPSGQARGESAKAAPSV